MSDRFSFGKEVVWSPTPDYVKRSHLTSFMKRNGIADFEALMNRSTDDIEWFTDALLSYLDIRFRKPYARAVDFSADRAFPKWCIGGRLNIVYNCIDKWVENSETANKTALVWEGEEGSVRTVSYRTLALESNQCANALRSLGLKKGDVIGLFMPMTPEIVIALLSIARIGGVILPLFSGYGSGAIASRLKDAGARALFTADGFFRRGAVVPLKATADEALLEVPSVEHVVVSNRCGHTVEMKAGRDHWWGSLMESQPREAPIADTDAEDLLMIIYTSGTSGKPKGAVHTHCGFPVKAAQDMAFGTDVHAGDVIYWMTDMGWMMGPWLVFGSLLLGATSVVYDGAPDFPSEHRLWELVERHRINVLGVSPTLIRSMMRGVNPTAGSHDLSSIRSFASTGEPWNHDPWMWLFETVGERKRPIINYSGGTEISGGIMMGNPVRPLKPMAFSALCPGMDADVFDESGNSVKNEVGELVIKKPWIGMTRGFWKDRRRYMDSYWSRWKDIWTHGDWAAVDDDGSWYILGRSDDTIKIAGKRVGPAEVESVLVSHPAVLEAAAIGVPDEIKGSDLVCFCVPAGGQKPSDLLEKELKSLVAGQLGKPLKPARIVFVADIPKTRNAKIMRRVIRKAYLGEDPGDISSLVNPAAVAAIRSVNR